MSVGNLAAKRQLPFGFIVINYHGIALCDILRISMSRDGVSREVLSIRDSLSLHSSSCFTYIVRSLSSAAF